MSANTASGRHTPATGRRFSALASALAASALAPAPAQTMGYLKCNTLESVVDSRLM